MSTEYVVEPPGLTKEYKGFKAVDGLDMAIGHGVVHGQSAIQVPDGLRR